MPRQYGTDVLSSWTVDALKQFSILTVDDNRLSMRRSFSCLQRSFRNLMDQCDVGVPCAPRINQLNIIEYGPPRQFAIFDIDAHRRVTTGEDEDITITLIYVHP